MWDIPGVQPLTAFRTELQVIKADNQDGTTKGVLYFAYRTYGLSLRIILVYLLAVERLSLKHCFIDLWENPLCRGNNVRNIIIVLRPLASGFDPPITSPKHSPPGVDTKGLRGCAFCSPRQKRRSTSIIKSKMFS